MQKIQRVLSGVEFTPAGDALTSGSLQAVREAAWLCSRTGASLKLLHSTWNDEHGGPGAPPGEQTMEIGRREAAEAGVDASVQIVDERPWMALVKEVLHDRADMVCIGRMSLADAPGFGSVAAKVLRKCPAPVWAVTPGAALPPKQILVASDLSSVADRATELALSLAGLSGAEVRVLHAWQVPMEMQLSEGRRDEAGLQARRRELQEKALEHVKGTLAERGQVHVQIRVVCDAPTHAIQREVADQGADLVALGSVSRGGVAGFLIGNTAERLLRRIETSVLAVKPEDFVCPIEV